MDVLVAEMIVGVATPATIGTGSFGFCTQKSVWICGMDCPSMIQPKLEIRNAGTPPSETIFASLEYAEPPRDHSNSPRRSTVALVMISNPLLFIWPTFCSCELRKPND